MTILVTGAAGFIGYHLCKSLINLDHTIVGIDSLNNYYTPGLKYGRLRKIGIDFEEGKKRVFINEDKSLYFHHENIAKAAAIRTIFNTYEIDIVIHLAAQAGVRYSLEFPEKYVEANVVGFFNVLQLAKEKEVKHFIYASSSSVYGLNKKMPLSVSDPVDHPISLYAASKKSNELFAHSYSHLFDLPTTGLRFFTVYGPWGRPDMAYFKFTKSILKNEEIMVFNNGDMYRDFTYIDDIVDGIIKLIEKPPKRNDNWLAENPTPPSSSAPYRVLNIGNQSPIKLMDFINILEDKIGQKAIISFRSMQPGDVYKTYADVSELQKITGYSPNTSLEDGIEKFVDWYSRWKP